MKPLCFLLSYQHYRPNRVLTFQHGPIFMEMAAESLGHSIFRNSLQMTSKQGQDQKQSPEMAGIGLAGPILRHRFPISKASHIKPSAPGAEHRKLQRAPGAGLPHPWPHGVVVKGSYTMGLAGMSPHCSLHPHLLHTGRAHPHQALCWLHQYRLGSQPAPPHPQYMETLHTLTCHWSPTGLQSMRGASRQSCRTHSPRVSSKTTSHTR